jgi:hypothetical protein
MQRALEVYEATHASHPDNLECLRYLLSLIHISEPTRLM